MRLQFADYLRCSHLNREVSKAVRYAKDAPRKAELLRDFFLAAAEEINKNIPKETK
jgi:hypothetical protein